MILTEQFVFFFSWEHCEFLSLSYLCLNTCKCLIIPSTIISPVLCEVSRICTVFWQFSNATGVSYLSRQLGKGRVRSFTGTIQMENEAITRFPIICIHPARRVRLTVGLENVLSALVPWFSPYPSQYTCLDILYIFRPYMIMFLCEI